LIFTKLRTHIGVRHCLCKDFAIFSEMEIFVYYKVSFLDFVAFPLIYILGDCGYRFLYLMCGAISVFCFSAQYEQKIYGIF